MGVSELGHVCHPSNRFGKGLGTCTCVFGRLRLRVHLLHPLLVMLQMVLTLQLLVMTMRTIMYLAVLAGLGPRPLSLQWVWV